MYFKEARRTANNLDSAIDALSRAGTIIKRSEVQNNSDIEICNEIREINENIREVINYIRQQYAGMND